MSVKQETNIFNPLNYPLCLELPARITVFSAWHEHTPFAMWLVAALRPQLIVELGTHYGDSYCAFCQAVSHLKLETKCFAVDTWEGDPHASAYGPQVLADLRAHHDPLYGGFSRLLQSTFKDALAHFADASIDLLHIDGYHTYEAVKEDFTTWLPKLRQGGVVLFHDINVRERDFGVWRLWEEIRVAHPHFEFVHGHGLGVLVVGETNVPELQALCTVNIDEMTLVRELFFALGQRVSLGAAGSGKEQALKAAADREQQQLQAAHDQLTQLQTQEQERARLTVEVAELAQARQVLLARCEAQTQLLEAQTAARQEAEKLSQQAWQTIAQMQTQLAEQGQEAQHLTRQLWEQEQSLSTLRAAADAAQQDVRELLLIDEELARPGVAWRSGWNAEPVTVALVKAHHAPPSSLSNGWARPPVAAQLLVEPEPLRGALDEPEAEAYISTRCAIRGWVFAAGGVIEKVAVFLDDHFIGTVPYGLARPDVAQAFPQYGRTACGYAGQLTLDDKWVDGASHLLLVQISDDQGHTLEFVRSVFVHRDSYDVWIRSYEPDAAALSLQRQQAPLFAYRPLISIITPVYNTPPDVLRAMLESVLAQTYDNWQLCLADGGSTAPEVRQLLTEYARRDARIRVEFLERNLGISGNSNVALALATGAYIALLDHDDTLTPDALFTYVQLLNEDRALDIFYSDEDKLDEQGVRCQPFFKPDWSPEYFRGVMYVGHLLCFRRSLLAQVGEFDERYDGVQDFELMLRLSEQTTQIKHVPRVLYHWRQLPGSLAKESHAKRHISELQRDAVNAHLARQGLPARAELASSPHRLSIVPAPMTEPDLVSIIIPTKDAPEYLEKCLRSIYERSSYTHYEVVLVDNDTTDPRALALMEQFPVKRVALPGKFNFSRANNTALPHARGQYLLFLNNDTEVITPAWLEQMTYYARQSDVGAVGALLLFPDQTVQHAGVILGPRGTADHLMRGFSLAGEGYAGSLICAREVTGVTAACLLMKRRDFEAVGGFNEHYQTHYQDMDLCLRLRSAGQRIIFTPRAQLFHHESKTRQTYYDWVDRILLLDSWPAEFERDDPYYNPHFDPATTDYSRRV